MDFYKKFITVQALHDNNIIWNFFLITEWHVDRQIGQMNLEILIASQDKLDQSDQLKPVHQEYAHLSMTNNITYHHAMDLDLEYTDGENDVSTH